MLHNDRLAIGAGRWKTYVKDETRQKVVVFKHLEKKWNSARIEEDKKRFSSASPHPHPCDGQRLREEKHRNFSPAECWPDSAHGRRHTVRGKKGELQTVRNARLDCTSCYHYARRSSHGYKARCEATLRHPASSLSLITVSEKRQKERKRSGDLKGLESKRRVSWTKKRGERKKQVSQLWEDKENSQVAQIHRGPITRRKLHDDALEVKKEVRNYLDERENWNKS